MLLMDEIRRRAHEIFCERGCMPGKELNDWLRAEVEIRARYKTGMRAPHIPAGWSTHDRFSDRLLTDLPSPAVQHKSMHIRKRGQRLHQRQEQPGTRCRDYGFAIRIERRP